MKVESQGSIVPLRQEVHQASYDQRDANKMHSIMTRNKNSADFYSKNVVTESASAPSGYKQVKNWYEEFKQDGHFDLKSLMRSLNKTFNNQHDVRNALWYSYNQELAAKGTENASPVLFNVLEEELLGTFSASIMTDIPQTREDLKARLADFYHLGAHKEQALFHTWAELKSQPDMAATVDIIRTELGHVITMNALAKNFMTNSHKIELE
ncbi:hypothetical protein BS333_06205 [Vibrio azureus]|uniref:Putative type III secretion system effector n=1 Tax=Vibrio azureus NBRC 104587 TaxID=1219077 RepID=U3AM14_9VIBR|nr:YopR/YscH family type III secretion effector [Vibrio azureus]AUI86009.1 hypothetical protein BS333_06205 [Vibrio azureus]GAD74317.1 putative type III secretion system effector [Vibrio azureus NBRC 104587]